VKNRVGLWAVVLLAVFLIGFIPPNIKLHRVNGELDAANRGLALGRVRDAIGFTYFEASRKNYGVAAGYASQFFSQVRELSDRATPDLRAKLESLFGYRDAVTAGLAKGDPAVMGPLQDLYAKVESELKR
jgi:hypothetical protein